MGERERERGRDIINITEERERNCKECRESAREENTGQKKRGKWKKKQKRNDRGK